MEHRGSENCISYAEAKKKLFGYDPDSHPEWSGSDKGTHRWVLSAFLLISSVAAAIPFLWH